MTPLQVLTAARVAEQRLVDIAEARARLMDVATTAGIDLTQDRVQHGRGDRIGETAAGLADFIAELDEQAARMRDSIADAERLIDSMPRERHRELLRRRYISGQSWERIYQAMQYSDRSNMYRAHRTALRILAGIQSGSSSAPGWNQFGSNPEPK